MGMPGLQFGRRVAQARYCSKGGPIKPGAGKMLDAPDCWTTEPPAIGPPPTTIAALMTPFGLIACQGGAYRETDVVAELF